MSRSVAADGSLLLVTELVPTVGFHNHIIHGLSITVKYYKNYPITGLLLFFCAEIIKGRKNVSSPALLFLSVYNIVAFLSGTLINWQYVRRLLFEAVKLHKKKHPCEKQKCLFRVCYCGF